MYSEFGKEPRLVIAAVITAVMLFGTTAISSVTTGSVLAYDRNHGTSQANACGNGFIPSNIGCQNTGSLIQGDENSVALIAHQTFPVKEEPDPTHQRLFFQVGWLIVCPPGFRCPGADEFTPELTAEDAKMLLVSFDKTQLPQSISYRYLVVPNTETEDFPPILGDISRPPTPDGLLLSEELAPCRLSFTQHTITKTCDRVFVYEPEDNGLSP